MFRFVEFFNLSKRGLLLAMLLVASVAGCSEKIHEFVLKESGAAHILFGRGEGAPLARFDSAVAYGFFIASHQGRQVLVRESFSGDKGTVVVMLNGDGTFSRASYFSIDMLASGDSGSNRWSGVEILLDSPRKISGTMWDDLLVEFEMLEPGGKYRPSSGTIIPTAVYSGGVKVEDIAYVSSEAELSRIDIETLKRVEAF